MYSYWVMRPRNNLPGYSGEGSVSPLPSPPLRLSEQNPGERIHHLTLHSSNFYSCITASGSRNHQLLAAMKKRRKSPNLPQDEGAPRLFWVLSEWGRALILWGRAPIILGALQEPTSTHPLSKPPPLPTCLQHQLIPPPPPYLGQGGTTHPSTPFDLKSSVATSWPQDGFLTTSQAITMNPRSQWTLFEFGKWLNCERICIQKFSCCSGERGHFVLVSLMGRL